MKIDKNNLPLVEDQQFISEEQLNLEKLLSQLQQPIPNGFVELESLKHMCSTQDWKEPVCERYGCLINGEWKQIDISHTLLEKLGLTEDIPYPVHISPTVLEKGLDHYFAYNVEDGAEIFLNQPLTINNLALNITRWLTEINQLKEKITNLEGEKITNQQTITELQTELDNLTNHITELGNLLTTERTNSQSEITNLKDWKNQLKFNLVPLFWPQAFYTEDTPTAAVLVAKVKKLVQEKEQIETERDDYQTKWDISLEGLEQKGEIITNYLQKIEELEREKERLKNENNAKQQELTQKDNEVTDLKKKTKNLEIVINDLREDLEKEQNWWDKWINDPKQLSDYRIEIPVDREGEIKFFVSSSSVHWPKPFIFEYFSGRREKSRELVKCVYEYYKNQQSC